VQQKHKEKWYQERFILSFNFLKALKKILLTESMGELGEESLCGPLVLA